MAVGIVAGKHGSVPLQGGGQGITNRTIGEIEIETGHRFGHGHPLGGQRLLEAAYSLTQRGIAKIEKIDNLGPRVPRERQSRKYAQAGRQAGQYLFECS